MNVSKGLTLVKTLKARINSLNDLRDKVSTQDRFFSSDKQTTPMYEVSEVDKKIVGLQRLLFELESSIKDSNATTEIVDIEGINIIFEPLK